jgi:hypothetical protein
MFMKGKMKTRESQQLAHAHMAQDGSSGSEKLLVLHIHGPSIRKWQSHNSNSSAANHKSVFVFALFTIVLVCNTS